jgi:hypothetical protein
MASGSGWTAASGAAAAGRAASTRSSGPAPRTKVAPSSTRAECSRAQRRDRPPQPASLEAALTMPCKAASDSDDAQSTHCATSVGLARTRSGTRHGARDLRRRLAPPPPRLGAARELLDAAEMDPPSPGAGPREGQAPRSPHALGPRRLDRAVISSIILGMCAAVTASGSSVACARAPRGWPRPLSHRGSLLEHAAVRFARVRIGDAPRSWRRPDWR